MAELQLAFPEKFNKVLRMEISNASLESLIIGSFRLIKLGPDRQDWQTWTFEFFPSLTNLTLLPGSCLDEIDEDSVFGTTSQEQRGAELIRWLTECIKHGIKYFGQGSIPNIAFKH